MGLLSRSATSQPTTVTSLPTRLSPSAPLPGQIVSRFFTPDGVPAYHVKVGKNDMPDVNIEDVLHFVSQQELERFENEQFRIEALAEIRKVVEKKRGQPRKQVLQSDGEEESTPAGSTTANSITSASDERGDSEGRRGRPRPAYTQFYKKGRSKRTRIPVIETAASRMTEDFAFRDGGEEDPEVNIIRVATSTSPLREVTDLTISPTRTSPKRIKLDVSPESTSTSSSGTQNYRARSPEVRIIVPARRKPSSQQAQAPPMRRPSLVETSKQSPPKPKQTPKPETPRSAKPTHNSLIAAAGLHSSPSPSPTPSPQPSAAAPAPLIQPSQSHSPFQPKSNPTLPPSPSAPALAPVPTHSSQPPPPPSDSGSESGFYDIEAILSHGLSDPRTHPADLGTEPVVLYQVKWAGYEEATWEPEESFADTGIVREYWEMVKERERESEERGEAVRVALEG
ncbi:hypothetical protein M8818_007606 [Zalaria obscura]|uniref:Uncharacterized protein n=1 Tax=Zalaria obscura TaxID=2024903 RepID=A0ACC3S6K2_9PEZI